MYEPCESAHLDFQHYSPEKQNVSAFTLTLLTKISMHNDLTWWGRFTDNNFTSKPKTQSHDRKNIWHINNQKKAPQMLSSNVDMGTGKYHVKRLEDVWSTFANLWHWITQNTYLEPWSQCTTYLEPWSHWIIQQYTA